MLRPVRILQRFFRLEAASGITLMLATALALLAANSPLEGSYAALLELPAGFHLGPFALEKTLLHWINDGLMAVFFLLIGLEVKREVMLGELSGIKKALLPLIGALGGVTVPALIYLYFNAGTEAAHGWAIPTATDIAFSLGVLALFGSRVPTALKVFLMALAVIDDLAAVLVIALFYTRELNIDMLMLAALPLAALVVMNFYGVRQLIPYLALGALLWFFVLKSGVHATVAGVALGLLIPLRVKGDDAKSPAALLEHTLHPYVAFGIIPIFAFANAGVPLYNITPEALLAPIPLGIMLGLFLGKQLGIFAFSWATVRLGLAAKPKGVTWMQLYGVCVIAGIGFTMSLFIGALAFDNNSQMLQTRLGVISGSLCSAILGYILLALSLRTRTDRS